MKRESVLLKLINVRNEDEDEDDKNFFSVIHLIAAE
jgi:hypothetical protein